MLVCLAVCLSVTLTHQPTHYISLWQHVGLSVMLTRARHSKVEKNLRAIQNTQQKRLWMKNMNETIFAKDSTILIILIINDQSLLFCSRLTAEDCSNLCSISSILSWVNKWGQTGRLTNVSPWRDVIYNWCRSKYIWTDHDWYQLQRRLGLTESSSFFWIVFANVKW